MISSKRLTCQEHCMSPEQKVQPWAPSFNQLLDKKQAKVFIHSFCFTMIKHVRMIRAFLTVSTFHCNENPIYVFLFRELRGLSPNFHIHVSVLWAIYKFRGSVHIFSCSRIGRSIVGISKSFTDIWMWKLGLWPSNFFSGYIWFEFSVLVLCSAKYNHIKK